MYKSLLTYYKFLTLILFQSILFNADAAPVDRGEYLKATRRKWAEQAVRESVGKSQRDRSDAYLYWAGKFRGATDFVSATRYFEKAIQTDSTNARAYIIYGDFVGSRGLFEHANFLYKQAESLLREGGEKDLQQRLQRSFHIFHRDAKDGIKVVDSRHFSLLVKPFYRNEQTLLSAISRQETSESIPQDFYALGERRNTIQHLVPLTAAEKEIEVQVKLRFNSNPWLPTLGYTGEEIEVDPALIDFENVDTGRDTTSRHSVFLSKSFSPLHGPLAINYNLYYDWKKAEGFNAKGDTAGLSEPEGYRADATITLNMQEDVISLILGTERYTIDPTGTIQGNEGNQLGRLSDDESWVYSWKLRYSDYLTASEIAKQPLKGEAARFSARRSNHYELELLREKRLFNNSIIPLIDIGESFSKPLARNAMADEVFSIKEDRWSMFLTYEALGLFDGKWDLISVYEYQRRRINKGLQRGRTHAHRLLVRPRWVPIYNLYHQEFTTGLEYLTVSLPVTYDKVDVPFDRITIGSEIEAWYVLPYVTIKPKASFALGRYDELGRNEWAFSFEIEFIPGTDKIITVATY